MNCTARAVALGEADLEPLRALDDLQRKASGAGSSFCSMLRQHGGRWTLQAKLHLDSQTPPTHFWRTETLEWDLPKDGRLWKYRELEAGREPYDFDRWPRERQIEALRSLHGGDDSGRPAVRRAAMHEMVGREVEAVLDVRGYWVWSRPGRPPMAGHRIHFEHIWVRG